MSRRRRALLLGGLALILGGLAAHDVAGREAALRRSVGGLVDVVVARAPIAAGEPVRASALAVRRVPARFAPATRIAVARALIGRTAAVDVAPGTDMTAALVGGEGAGPAGAPVRRGERVAEVVARGSPELVVAGARVDVLVTPEPRAGAAGETLLALEDVEVLAAGPAGADGAGGAGAGASERAAREAAAGARVAAALRVTPRQALYLAAAQDFARELRLLARPPGDRGRGHAGERSAAVLP